MDRLLKINGKTYKAAPFDLNLVCDFEDAGIPMDSISDKMFNVLRMYAASSMGVDVKTAGKELSEHVANGESLDDISKAMAEMMDDSGFFRQETTDKSTGSQKRTRTKKTESEEVTS